VDGSGAAVVVPQAEEVQHRGRGRRLPGEAVAPQAWTVSLLAAVVVAAVASFVAVVIAVRWQSSLEECGALGWSGDACEVAAVALVQVAVALPGAWLSAVAALVARTRLEQTSAAWSCPLLHELLEVKVPRGLA